MTLPAFLLWADDCRMRTKLFPQARIQGVFNYCVLRRTRGPWETMPNVEQGEVLLSKVGKDHVLQNDELEVQAKLNANLNPTLILTLTLTLILTLTRSSDVLRAARLPAPSVSWHATSFTGTRSALRPSWRAWSGAASCGPTSSGSPASRR